MRSLAVVVLLCCSPAPAAAQASCPPDAVGCHTEDVDFAHREALFDGVMLDTGWVPSGSPIQVRFGVIVGGETTVDLGGTSVTSWPAALDVAVPGRPATGRLAFDYGFEVIARLRFNVRVAGISYSWEGNIPTGSIPTDLRVANALDFDPFVLPPSDPRPVTTMDATDAISLYDLPLTSGLVSIPGISGGFRVTATVTLETGYRTERIDVDPAIGPIDVEDGSTLVEAPDGYGPAQDLEILPRGVIDYDGVITLRPNVYFSIAGSRFDLAPFDLPIPIADVSDDTAFEPAAVRVPLPDASVDTTRLDFGMTAVGGTSERLLTVVNDGEAELVITPAAVDAPFESSADSRAIPPRSSIRLPVRFSPTGVGPADDELLLRTNDPDAPALTVFLTGEGFEPTPDAGTGADAGPMATPPTDGGCGCRTGGRNTTLLHYLVVFFGLLIAGSRRRIRQNP